METSAPGSLTMTPDVSPGEILAGKYRVEALLGTGGMGVVLAAVNVALEQRVAIKLLNADARSEGAIVSRFLREGRAAARLRSEHVARVLDFGTLADGRPYLVTERLFGHDLSAVIGQPKPLEVGSAVDYVMQACEGLAEAHAAGIVHRDLKPANLFLTETVSGRPLVKILDFGICKLEEDTSAPLTAHNALLGTPRYMSPEQLIAASDVDARADIWALGVILFELLTKMPPFDGDSLMQIVEHVARRPAPDVSSLRRDVPQGLAEIVARCLAKDPEGRFKSVLALSLALEPYGIGRRPSTPLRLARAIGDLPAPASVPTVSSESGSADVPVAIDVSASRVIGDYVMYGPLGSGGMAAVHFGVRVVANAPPHPVALKVLRAELAALPGSRSMLVDEARLAAAIRHRNVVGTVDAIDAGGDIVLALEYVPGVSLAQVIAASRAQRVAIPLSVANAVTRDTLRGLEAIHEACDPRGERLDIVHRDVSPHNILVDERGFARVTDFGIAKARGRLQTTTAAGVVKGKLGYLAPEQMHGRSSRASDVYATAAVFWEMLVGRPLVEGRDNERLAATLLGDFAPPSQHGVTCPPALEAMLMRALSREPAVRPTTREMADALAALAPIATEREIASFVDGILHDELVRRHATIAAMCAAPPPRPSAREMMSDPPRAPAEVAPSARERAAPPNDRGARPRLPFVLVAVGALALAGGSFVLGARTSSRVIKSDVAPPASPPPPAIESIAPSAAAPATEKSAPEPAPSAAATASHAASAATKPPVHAGTKPKRPDCTVPYTIDADGRKVWRRECFAEGH